MQSLLYLYTAYCLSSHKMKLVCFVIKIQINFVIYTNESYMHSTHTLPIGTSRQRVNKTKQKSLKKCKSKLLLFLCVFINFFKSVEPNLSFSETNKM